jgi:hypothetical protein
MGCSHLQILGSIIMQKRHLLLFLQIKAMMSGLEIIEETNIQETMLIGILKKIKRNSLISVFKILENLIFQFKYKK